MLPNHNMQKTLKFYKSVRTTETPPRFQPIHTTKTKEEEEEEQLK